MNATPYAHLTDKEFSRLLATLETPTDIGVEAMVRIDRLLDEISDIRSELDEAYRSADRATVLCGGMLHVEDV